MLYKIINNIVPTYHYTLYPRIYTYPIAEIIAT